MKCQQEYGLLDKAFDASPCLMAISTISDGRYTKVNKCFEEFTGYSEDEVIGRSSIELKIFDETSRNRLLSIFYNQGELRNVLSMYKVKDGTERFAYFSLEMFKYKGKKYFLSVANDVTEKKKMAEEISKLERFNLIGQMAATIAHEVRNPLTSVRGFLQLYSLKEDLCSYRGSFKLMIDELDRANNIISDFLSLSKPKEASKQKKNLNLILQHLQPLIVASGLTGNGTVSYELEPVPDIPLHEKEIHQLILNLTRNAFESMPNGGAVRIRTYIEEGLVVLAIKDQGPGIKTAQIEKLGTPFFTTKANGTGLGLAVCRQIAMNHSADIKFVSNSTGTEVFVAFNLPEYN